MQIITTAVIKGGTGKTATAASLAQAAAADGKKVLVADLDPQGNLTATVAADQNKAGVFQLLNGTSAAQLIQHTPQGIDAIAASPDIATVKTTTGSAKRLQNALNPLRSLYDICIIDTPPVMGELVFNALQAADGLIIPLEADAYSLQGLYQITDIAHQMQRSNPQLSIIGVVISRYDARPNISRYMRDVIAEKGAEIGAPLLMTIRPAIAVKEAAAFQKSLYQYAPACTAAKDFMQLYRMIVNSDK